MQQKIKTSNYWPACFTLVLILLTGACATAQQTPFKVFAHRGFRGLHPENTIRGLQKALTYGAVLEFDLAITRDKQVVVSHDAVLNPKITLGPDGKPLGKNKVRIYETDYAALQAYDVGKTPNKDFPEQERYPARIPLFSELVDSVKTFASARGLREPTYFVETKITAKTDSINHPGPKEFVDLMMKVIQEKDIQKQVIVQSFDPRTLQILRKVYPQVKLALLAKDSTSFGDNIKNLGFVPEYYSINAPFIDRELVDQCQALKTELIIGNCDDREEILRLGKLGVRSVISDFPLKSSSK